MVFSFEMSTNTNVGQKQNRIGYIYKPRSSGDALGQSPQRMGNRATAHQNLDFMFVHSVCS